MSCSHLDFRKVEELVCVSQMSEHNGERSAAFSDTPPKVMARWVARARALNDAQRLKLAFDLSDDVRRMSLSAIRSANPGWSEQQVQLRFVELHHGRELAARLSRRWSHEGE